MSAALACQKAQRARLIADAAITALVSADHIIDASGALDRFPAIIIGDDQELPLGDVSGVDRFSTIYSTLHIWNREPGLAGAKAIAGAVRDCLANATWTVDGWQCLETEFDSARFLRDPDGITSHAVIVFRQVLQRAS